jgi:signal transduction histidine kinase
VVVFRDVTREHEVERAKDEFISLASHQLKSPPTALSWNIELLLDGDAGPLTEGQREILQTMKTTTINMAQVINALLNVSRIELGTFIVNPKPVDFAVVAKEVVAELQKPIADKKLQLKQHYPDSLPTVPTDPGLAKVMIENLLSNAVKYTPEGGVITLGIDHHPDTQTLLIQVQDTGYGIPKAQQAKIFSKMFRADNIREKVDGTGFGLYLLKSIVEEVAKGKIWFESVEGQGTTFYVELPLSGMTAKEGTSKLA